jgi:hypothetical protein
MDDALENLSCAARSHPRPSRPHLRSLATEVAAAATAGEPTTAAARYALGRIAAHIADDGGSEIRRLTGFWVLEAIVCHEAIERGDGILGAFAASMNMGLLIASCQYIHV